MYFKKGRNPKLMIKAMIVTLFVFQGLSGQQEELKTALVKTNRIWVGVKANGDKGNFDYRAGFFPNDYNILGARGQYRDTWGGAGFRLTATNWTDPIDTLHSVAIYGPTNEFEGWAQGKVVDPLTNYVRYGYPSQVIDFTPLDLESYGTVDQTQFGDKTYDQIVEVTSQNILGINLNRKVMAWSQNFHDDYIILDVEFTNISNDTLHDFYINIESNGDNTFRSYGLNPSPGSGENYDPSMVWQHYYGGRVGDSLRVFYEYNADNPDLPGDNMGTPIKTQGGRMINSSFVWYSVLHASGSPYLNAEDDADDFLQPKVTYIGTETRIPYDNNSGNDEFGSKNFYAIRGEYSSLYPMTGNTHPGTYHGLNSDELGTMDYSDYPAGTKQNPNSKMWSSFGPYTFPANHKVRLVIANGYSGLDMETAKTIGEKWFKGELEDPPGLPDAEKGYFPAKFSYSDGASVQDKIKNRWISTGIDSVMQSASRAKWNFQSGYKVPQAPPPPSSLEITGLGTGVEIRWTDMEAELLDNFAGYRIMRRLSQMDTVYYEQVYNSDASDIASEHLYIDKDVIIGAQYYYYVQAKASIPENDPNAYPANRGKIIYSGRAFQPNMLYINPPHFSQDTLSNIAIVPNPYNINDPLLPGQGWTDQRGIQFFNLPAEITIRIFTENGDHIKTIEHASDVGSGYENWDMITKNQQVISSGVYIVVFETPKGEISYQKFLVVR